MAADELSKALAQRTALFAALADPMRLRIVGLCLARPHELEELVTGCGLTAVEVALHVDELVQVGVLVQHGEPDPDAFDVAPALLAMRVADLLAWGNPAWAVAQRANQYRERMIGRFFADGRLVNIPTQRKQLEVVLDQLALSFDLDRAYSEAEVADVLRGFHADVATLRRELVNAGVMTRDRGEYRRVLGARAHIEDSR